MEGECYNNEAEGVHMEDTDEDFMEDILGDYRSPETALEDEHAPPPRPAVSAPGPSQSRREETEPANVSYDGYSPSRSVLTFSSRTVVAQMGLRPRQLIASHKIVALAATGVRPDAKAR